MGKKSQVQNRIVGHGDVAPGQLLANPLNFRRHPGHQLDALRGSLKELGWIKGVLVNKRTGYVVDGHARVEEALRQGLATVPVTYIDLTPEEERLALAVLDPITEMAVRDQDALDSLLAEVSTEDPGLQALLEEMGGAGGGDDGLLPGTDPDEAPEPPEEPYVKTGELYELGTHRILCGDSTKAEDVDVVIGGERADICWSDPPWNVAYQGGTKAALTISNDDLGAAFPGFCSAFCGEMVRVMKPGGMIYMVMGPSEWPTIHAALVGAGTHWSSTIIWAKDSLVLARKDYHTQYEPIWYGWVDGAPRIHPLEDRKQSDLWEIPRPKRNGEHPTMKPVELVARCLNNSSGPGDLVYEPFSGSGTTIIACEQTGRRCRAIEMDPKYVQVAITRWEKATGKKAKLVDA